MSTEITDAEVLDFIARTDSYYPPNTVEFSIEESANANESLYAPALKVVAGKVKIPDAPGWGFTPNPDWIAKASDLVSERPASR